MKKSEKRSREPSAAEEIIISDSEPSSKVTKPKSHKRAKQHESSFNSSEQTLQQLNIRAEEDDDESSLSD